jgi:hypothetical protein
LLYQSGTITTDSDGTRQFSTHFMAFRDSGISGFSTIPAQAGMTEYHEFFNVTNHPIRYSPAFFACVSA